MRTTLVSYRALDLHPGRCFDYEFEDLFLGLVGAELIAPHRPPTGTFLRLRREDALASVPLSGPQDLLFANVMSVWDLQALTAIPNWRSGSKVTVCWIKEFFAQTQIPTSILNILREFDLVVLNFEGSVASLQERLPRDRVLHVPLGIDTLRFDPYPDPPLRGIDISWVGRHDAALHEEIFSFAQREELYYHFNSGYTDTVGSYFQHRALFSSMLKRTKLFVVQPAKFNDPQATGGQQEVGYRYFEGAAAGAILVGHSPSGGSLDGLLPWEDAVIEFPGRVFDLPEFLRELLEKRDEPVRRRSVVHCLRHHDWVYRIEEILEALGISDPTVAANIATRRAALAAAARIAEAAPA